MAQHILDDLQADPEISDLVLAADSRLLQDFSKYRDALKWNWRRSAENSKGTILEMTYEGHSDSKEFTIEELKNFSSTVWEAHYLWRRLLVRNVKKSADNIIDVLLEFEREPELQEA